ncbi:MAG TPA: hypothetical protein VJ246_03645 [Patescibacteria group bacterium]|nr:hypothetical protein [Patescibacteria group bacterium]
MNTLTTLQTQAISAAEKQDWDAAIMTNTNILELDPQNTSALNRLGFSYLQKGNKKKAKDTYERVISLDAFNSIAKKYLTVLENGNEFMPASTGSFYENFIEEPGKTKTVSLCRLADPSILTTIPVATPCTLVIKQYRISVETESGVYLGSLPDDLSHSLTKLMKGGNLYRVVVKSVSKANCVVFIKELSRSKKQAHIISFPTTISSHNSGIHEELLVDATPVDVSETGQERESSEDFTEEFTREEEPS